MSVPVLLAAPVFVKFSLPHLVAMALTLLVPLGLSLWVRKSGERVPTRLIAILATVILLLARVGHGIVLAEHHPWITLLPFHLCDIAMFAVIVALLKGSRLSFDIAYFFGLTATLQAIITPNIPFDYPHPRFFTYFVWHCGIVACDLYLVFGLKNRPTVRTVWQCYGWLHVYALAAGAINFLLGVNYGYLRYKPTGGSVMDHFGEWPFYIIGLSLFALVSFWIFYLPFGVANLIHKRTTKMGHPGG